MDRNEAQWEIARRANLNGDHWFAAECRAGAWDETNRRDIAALMGFPDGFAPKPAGATEKPR